MGSLLEHYKLNRDVLCKWLFLVFCCIAFGSIILRATNTSITYDEAYTYCEYVETLLNAHSVSIMNPALNNHWLNTILIAFVTAVFGVRYSIILIRLPILVFAGVYYYLIYRLYVNKNIGLLQASLLASNYYLAEFLGLARGYGMATFFVLCAVLFYIQWRDSDYLKQSKIMLVLLMLLLASASNSICLLICVAFGMVAFFRIKKNEIIVILKRYWWFLLVSGISFLLILKWHFLSTGEGKSIYSNTTSQFPSIMQYVKDYVGMYTDYQGVILTLSVVTVLLVIVGVISRCFIFKDFLKSTNDISLIAIVLLVVMILINSVFKKGSCEGRALLPMFPVFVYALFEMSKGFMQKIAEKYSIVYEFLGLVASIFLMISFVNNISIVKTSDWYPNYDQSIYTNGYYYIRDEYDFEVKENMVDYFYDMKSHWDMENIDNIPLWRKGCT